MSMFRECDGGIEWRSADQFVRVEAWGDDAVRVRSGVGRLLEDQPGALLDPPAPTSAPIIEPKLPSEPIAAKSSRSSASSTMRVASLPILPLAPTTATFVVMRPMYQSGIYV